MSAFLASAHPAPPVSELVWVLILASITAAVARKIGIPYTVALVAVGVTVSGLGLLRDLRPTSDIILLVFLPPLLFEAALTLDVPSIGRAMPVILLLAIPGVMVSAILIGLPIDRLTPLSLWPALLFGAFISATDPVAVVASFRHFKAPEALTYTIEGESLFNDGTALVLSTLLLSAAKTGHFDVTTTVGLFVWSVIGGMVIGGLAGFLMSEMTRLVDDHLIEITMSAVLAYGSYLLADLAHASGVISVVLAGIVYGSHGRRAHLSDETRRFLDDFWEYLGFLANAVLFILIGLSARLPSLRRDLGWVLLAIAVVLLSRAIIVYALTLSLHRISFAYGHVLFWGGLRGGVALAVALSLPDSVPGHSLILTMTFGVVLFTILVQGITIEPLAKRLGLLGSKVP